MQHDEQLELVGEPIFDEEKPALLVQDSDLCLVKLYTDLVVKGHARSSGEKPLFLESKLEKIICKFELRAIESSLFPKRRID